MTKTARAAKTATKTVAAIDVRVFMKAWGGAQGEGRATAFREEPTEENMQELLDAAAANLRKLMRKGGKTTAAKATKTTKTASTKKPAKVAAKKTTTAKKPVLKNAAGKDRVAKQIASLTTKIVSLRAKRSETEDKARRAKLLGQIRDLRAERDNLKKSA